MPRLIKSEIDKLTEPGDYYDEGDGRLAGFFVRVRKSVKGTSKTYYINGKPKGYKSNRSIKIGKHGIITPDAARTEAIKIKGQLADGKDPNAEKRQRAAELQEQQNRNDLTLRRLREEYLRLHDLKPRTTKDYIRFPDRCLRDWLDKPVVEITEGLVIKRYEELTGSGVAQANGTMRILHALLNHARATHKTADGKPLFSENPAQVLWSARLIRKVPRRDTVVEPHELQAWYRVVSNLPNTTARDFLMLVIYTGFRYGEAAALKWDDVDLVGGILTITDTKNRDPLRTPLSKQVRALLERRQARRSVGDAYVFPGTGATGHIVDIRDSIDQVVQATGKKFTCHDLRRTFATEGDEVTSHDKVKRLMNHRLVGDITTSYKKFSTETLREASQAIADRLDELMGLKKGTGKHRQAKH